MRIKITALPGDGIGPEVIKEALKVLEAVARRFKHELNITLAEMGGKPIREQNDPLPPETLEACFNSQAVLLGAVGHPDFDDFPVHLRPEAGLLPLRPELRGVFPPFPPPLFVSPLSPFP